MFSQIESSIQKLRDKSAEPIGTEKAFESLSREASIVETDLKRLAALLEDFSSWTEAEKLELLPAD
jgi:hypothetical protein